MSRERLEEQGADVLGMAVRAAVGEAESADETKTEAVGETEAEAETNLLGR